MNHFSSHRDAAAVSDLKALAYLNDFTGKPFSEQRGKLVVVVCAETHEVLETDFVPGFHLELSESLIEVDGYGSRGGGGQPRRA